jgi:hypothetical protein
MRELFIVVIVLVGTVVIMREARVPPPYAPTWGSDLLHIQ